MKHINKKQNGAKNKTKNLDLIKILTIFGIGILIISVSGCFEEKKEPNQTNNQTQNVNLTKITEEQAIAIANATGEVQKFWKQHSLPFDYYDPSGNITCEIKDSCDSKWAKCYENKGAFAVECYVQPVLDFDGMLYQNATKITITINSTSGEILEKYPKMEYIKNATYCESDRDCQIYGQFPKDGEPCSCCRGCINSIHWAIWTDKSRVLNACWLVEGCKCINNTCMAIKLEKLPASNGTKTTQATNVIDANNQFAFELYSKFSSDKGNLFFSPYSISTALAMAYEGARGKTAEEMQSVLHFPKDDTSRRTGFSGIIEQINKGNRSYELHAANALWAQKDYKFLDNYFNTIEQYYGGKVTNLDFVTETEKSRQTINIWVENQTNNKIKDLIPQGVLDDMTRLVLTNAIYFKGKWAKQFDKENTLEADFKVTPGKTVKVQMMSLLWEEFNYTETDDLQILELPYDGGELSMLILLPKENNLQTIEESLTLEKLSEWNSNLREQEVNVYLPKFKFETKYFMKETLEEMGMPTAFSMDANFSGMDGTDWLYISSVIHQAFVEVNEEGTEAAAATAVVITDKGMPTTFRADHPFIFIMQEKGTGSILFLGRVADPGKN